MLQQGERRNTTVQDCRYCDKEQAHKINHHRHHHHYRHPHPHNMSRCCIGHMSVLSTLHDPLSLPRPPCLYVYLMLGRVAYELTTITLRQHEATKRIINPQVIKITLGADKQ